MLCLYNSLSGPFERLSLNFIQGQGHTSMLWEYPSILCPLNILWTLWTIYSYIHPNVSLSETVCRIYEQGLQTQGQGQLSRLWDLRPLISCPLHISWTLWTIFIKLHPYVPFGETVCRTHDSAGVSRSLSQFKVTGFTLAVGVCYISPEPFESFHETSPK